MSEPLNSPIHGGSYSCAVCGGAIAIGAKGCSNSACQAYRQDRMAEWENEGVRWWIEGGKIYAETGEDYPYTDTRGGNLWITRSDNPDATDYILHLAGRQP